MDEVSPIVYEGEGSWMVPAGCTQINYTLYCDTTIATDVVHILLNGEEARTVCGSSGSVSGAISVSDNDVLTVNYECPTEKTRSEVVFVGVEAPIAQIPPPPPTGFVIAEKAAGHVKLSWNPLPMASSFVDHYKIYQIAYNVNGDELYGGLALVDGNVSCRTTSFDMPKLLCDYRYRFEIIPVKNDVPYEGASFTAIMETPVLNYNIETPGRFFITVPEGYNLATHEPMGNCLQIDVDGIPAFRDPFMFPDAGPKCFHVQVGQKIAFEYLNMVTKWVEMKLEAIDSLEPPHPPKELCFKVINERDPNLYGYEIALSWEPSPTPVDGYDLYLVREDYTEKVSLVSEEIGYTFCELVEGRYLFAIRAVKDCCHSQAALVRITIP